MHHPHMAMARAASDMLPGKACFRPQPAAPAACRQRHPRLPGSCSASHQPETSVEQHGNAKLQRRSLLFGSLLLASTAASPPPASLAAAEEASSSAGADDLLAFSNPSQGYTLLRPASWEQVGKAGADSLFRDPAQKSTTVGVTVYPVTIDSLEQFGDLQTVGQRLLNSEREKESTLGVAMVEQLARTGASGGFSIYDFEYELESTRGRKRVMSTVAIVGRKLYIANGSVSCGKAASCESAEAVLPLVRRVTRSISIGS